MEPREPKAIVEKVMPGSIAEELGIEPGDRLVSVNGLELRDVIDYRYQTADEFLELVIEHSDGETLYCDVEKELSEDLGIEFTEELFDGVYTCDNRCAFCFVHQLPKGLRRSLYLMDDDYRLSFLHNNYVTLTNVSHADLQRIVEQRLSPLFISVHATDPDVRENLLGCAQARDILKQLRFLASHGIEINAQVVMCPGINDGSVLDRTIEDLAKPEYGVTSLAVVPVGLSQFRQRLRPLQTVSPELARATIHQVHAWQRALLPELGTRFVFAADELYLDGDVPFPPRGAYEGFPQLEDGVGVGRLFLDDLAKLKRKISRMGAGILGTPKYRSIALVTGISADSLIKKAVEFLNETTSTKFAVHAIHNRFFGETVTVTGLLTGTDIREQLTATPNLEEAVIIPAICLRDGIFLDDLTPSDVEAAIGRPVIPVKPSIEGLLEACFERPS